MQSSRRTSLVAFAALIAGLLLLVLGLLMTPEFVAAHFSSSGTLKGSTEHAIQVARVLAAVSGVVALFLALNLRYPARVNAYFESLARLLSSLIGRRLRTRRFYLSFCLLCFALALVMGLTATQSGTGLSFDSVQYVMTGESLSNGDGFGSVAGVTFKHYPLYPLLIAGFTAFGFEAEQAARLIPILSFALLMFPVFFLGRAIGGVAVGYLACAMCLVSAEMLYLATWAWPDMPCVLFSALAVLFLVKFTQRPEPGNATLIAAGVFTGLAILTRFSAVSLLPVALLVIVLRGRWGAFRSRGNVLAVHLGSSWTGAQRLRWSLMFLAVSMLPLLPWLARNLISTGRLTAGFSQSGPYATSDSRLLEWLVADTTGTLLTPWFSQAVDHGAHIVGLPLGRYLAPALIVVGIAFLATFLTRRSGTARPLGAWIRENYIVILHILAYFGMLFATGLFFYMNLQQNYLAAAYPFVVMVGLSYLLWVNRSARPSALRPTIALIIVLVVVSLLGLQTRATVDYYYLSRDGQGGNDPAWVAEQGHLWIADNLPADAVVHSDVAEMIAYSARGEAFHLPHADREEQLRALFASFATAEKTFVIVFKEPFHRSYKPSVAEITALNEEYGVLEVVIDFPTSTVWRVCDDA